MPVVTKQAANHKPVTTPKLKTGVLSRVIPVSEMSHEWLKISLYGRSKSGKTRLISTFPKPVLILGAEDGTKSISNVKGVDFLRIVLDEAYAPPKGNYVLLSELLEFIDSLKTSEYKTVAMDTASALQDLVLADMLGFKEAPLQWNPMQLSEQWGKQTRQKYGERADAVKKILNAMLGLPRHVVITAHEKNFNEDDANADLLFPQIGSALSKSAAGWLNGAVDYICQTFIREKTETIDSGGIKIETKTGKMEYCLRTGTHDIFQTGFRVNPGVRIPDMIVDPSFQKIQSVINDTYYKK
jgi:hypothetical protein